MKNKERNRESKLFSIVAATANLWNVYEVKMGDAI